MAPLLLLVGPMTGCLNVLFPPFDPQVDHAPVLVNMRPAIPVFDRLPANVGLDCAPRETFVADSLDDADLDPLTVRWTLRIPTDPTADPQHDPGQEFILVETEIDPLPQPLPDGRSYDFAPFQLDRQTVLGKLPLVVLDDQAQKFSDEGQSLELRISDGGFKAGTNVAVDGKTVLFIAWPIRLDDKQCGTP